MHERTIGKGEDAQLLHVRAHTGGKFERGVLHPRTAEQTEAAMDRCEEDAACLLTSFLCLRRVLARHGTPGWP